MLWRARLVTRMATTKTRQPSGTCAVLLAGVCGVCIAEYCVALVCRNFWSVVHNMTIDEQKALLFFSTGR